MFLAEVGRPHWGVARNRKYNGKIGTWPIVMREPSERNSRNRPVGNIITKPIKSVNVDVYLEYFINKVIPVVVKNFPWSHKDVMIKIQQENAGPHIKEDDPDFSQPPEQTALKSSFSSSHPTSRT